MAIENMNGLIEEILKGNPTAVARAISLVENNAPLTGEVMKAVFPHTGQAVVVGITGAPGTGKSTLVNRMIAQLPGKKIGIVAVDPSSPYTGGAILGDRIRMMNHSVNPDVFIRSMATRGHLGGLAKASGEALMILEAAGKDYLLLETVGVGQDEVEVMKLADVIVVVLNPGLGDEIQIFKAGIMEIADVFVLNKADSPDTDRTQSQIEALLEMGGKQGLIPEVVKTVATEGRGIPMLIQAIEKITVGQNEAVRVKRKKRRLSWMLREIINARIYKEVMDHVRGLEFDEYVDKLFLREIDPYTLADQIVRRLKGR
ncbi:MAG: methylmalonyl Co-A mutase-associated GTPase MeaB [Candidatus Aminicenantes bacterium]|nr:methylmalonyl Co-A mutase-associated GTPase MeaB [Candidatus Aminicenantes bacterium]